MSLAFFGMGKDRRLGFSAASIASLLALGSAGFSFGKLFGGPLSDRLGGKRSLCLILSTMAVYTTAWILLLLSEVEDNGEGSVGAASWTGAPPWP